MKETNGFEMITISSIINVPVEKAWEIWTRPEHIVNWSRASEDWTTPFAENDLKVGGVFKTAYQSPDPEVGFVFEGEYTEIEPLKSIAYKIVDGRMVYISFEEVEKGTRITQEFGAEKENPLEMQKEGWSAILERFKKYAESLQ